MNRNLSGLYTFDNDTHKYIPIAQAKDIFDLKDCEEPDERQFIVSDDGEICPYMVDYINEGTDRGRKSIGNYFATQEEAEQAVEKLKTWKRLRDAGFVFYRNWSSKDPDGAFYYVEIHAKIEPVPSDIEFMKDLDLLFGVEEPVCRDSDETRYTGKEEE